MKGRHKQRYTTNYDGIKNVTVLCSTSNDDNVQPNNISFYLAILKNRQKKTITGLQHIFRTELPYQSRSALRDTVTPCLRDGDRFIRFCRAGNHEQQTDDQSDHVARSVAIAHI